MLFPSEHSVLLQQAVTNLPATWGSFRVFSLLELDVGGNGLSSNGVKVLASYMRHHSYLHYLGLAQTSSADLVAWKELFDSLKVNSSLTQIILDESNLGDPGVRLLADVLKVSMNLRQVDLDRNGITDVGGNDIMGALLCRTQCPLKHLSLQENNISDGLMSRIQEEIKYKWSNSFRNGGTHDANMQRKADAMGKLLVFLFTFGGFERKNPDSFDLFDPQTHTHKWLFLPMSGWPW